MANRRTPSAARRQARDSASEEQEALFGRVLSYLYAALPDAPVSAYGDLCILFDADGGGVDRLSLLPDSLLGNIVSRLPVKDAARTAVLSRLWRPVWRATPLVLLDTHLLPPGAGGASADADDIPTHLDRALSDAVAAAVSRALEAHPGPFRCVRVACCYMDRHRREVARWLRLLAARGAQECFLINRPCLDPKWPLPTTLFSMPNLERLYLGFWKFPDTANLPRAAAAFPRLRELGLCNSYVETQDIDFVLSRSPVLEILCFEAHLLPLRLRLVSHSLRCVQVHGCKLDYVDVVDAPRLERLMLETYASEDAQCRIKIGHAPALRVFGNFELEKDKLQVGNTIIKAATVLNASAMVPAVKILSVNVRFGVRNDTKMLPTFLRCFPNVEKLHIHSKKTTESTGKLNLKFWQESGAMKCILPRIKMMAFHDFRGEQSELAFLKFFVENAQVLETLVIVYANGCVTLSTRVAAAAKVKALFAGKRTTERCLLVVCESAHGEGCGLWNFKKGSDFSFPDPYACIAGSDLGVGHWYV